LSSSREDDIRILAAYYLFCTSIWVDEITVIVKVTTVRGS
jgi:hypothetical protein